MSDKSWDEIIEIQKKTDEIHLKMNENTQKAIDENIFVPIEENARLLAELNNIWNEGFKTICDHIQKKKDDSL